MYEFVIDLKPPRRLALLFRNGARPRQRGDRIRDGDVGEWHIGTLRGNAALGSLSERSGYAIKPRLAQTPARSEAANAPGKGEAPDGCNHAPGAKAGVVWSATLSGLSRLAATHATACWALATTTPSTADRPIIFGKSQALRERLHCSA
jgi:hypothetical protein